MSVSIYMKGDYEEIAVVWARENKANSKPNKANIIVQRSAFSGQRMDSCLRRNDKYRELGIQ